MSGRAFNPPVARVYKPTAEQTTEIAPVDRAEIIRAIKHELRQASIHNARAWVGLKQLERSGR